MTNRQKTPSWLPVLILAGLGISVIPHQVMTRTSEVSTALSPVLSSYEVIRMEPGEIEQQVRTTGELRLRFDETDFYFNLEPHDMRGPGYLAVETGPGGVTRTLPPQPVHTFKGVLAGREDTRGRFNLVDGGVEGVVYAPEGWVYVEPLRNYLPSAPAGELVVYSHSDIKPGGDFKCGVSLPKRLQRGVDRVTAQVEAATPTKYEFEVATEADYEYVQALGGSEEANREILGILNQVDGVYQNELLLQLRIGFQHTWDTPNDPYTAEDVFDRLDEFVAYWNSNFAAEQDYDLAHLWTGTDDDVPRGVAYESVVCAVRSLSYGLSKHNHFGRHKLSKYITAAHEIGHNLGATHPISYGSAYSPSEGACSTSIMWVGTVQGSGLTFCRLSREEIAEYVSRNHYCLTREPILLKPPTRLWISRSSFSPTTFSRVDLAWRDNSTVETGFIVERRRVGWSQWSELERTGANITEFSNTGLFPGITYIYRVRAFNAREFSAYSNEVEVTAASGARNRENWIIDTVAGSGRGRPHPVYPGNIIGSYGGDGGPAVEADLNYPRGVAVDGSGNLYIADTGNHRIRRVDATGIISTVAGTGQRTEVEVHIGGWLGEYGGDGGPAVEAHLNYPTAVAVDGSGNLYIADAWNHLVRRVDAGGTITTVAGSGTGTGRERYNNQGGYSGDGGPAVEARLNGPWGVAVDRSGNLYIADAGNQRVRRVDGAGVITTVAGNGTSNYSGDGGPAVEASLRGPVKVAVDGLGNLYIADSANNRIRQVDRSGIITTVAGVGHGRFSRKSGPANMAVLDNPLGVAADGLGNLFISDSWNNHIRRIDSMGIITTIAGTLNPLGYPEEDFSGDGGPAIRAGLGFPKGIAVSTSGTVYFAGRWNHRIRALARPPQAPTRLTATAVSSSRINLAWQHDSTNVDEFRVERRVARRAVWSEIGMTAASTRRFTDMGLKPTTTYEYRVRAFNVVRSSVFSNVARAKTLEVVPPTLTRFNPTRGPVGARVTLTGTHLNEATAVAFNGVSAPEFEVVSGRSIEAVVPSGATSGPISVVTPGGTAVSAEPFTVVFPPTLTGFTPATGPAGTRVTLTGTHFLGATEVLFNRVSAPGFEVLSGTSIEAVVPSGASSGPISVVTPGGTAVSTEPFTVVPPPTLTRFTPTTGPAGTRVTLTGTHFLGATEVLFNRVSAPVFEVVSATSIEAVVPSGATSGPISVVTPGGTAVSAEPFMVALPPTLTGFTPTTGPAGTRVALTGTHFLGATEVLFNRVSAPEFEVVSATSIEAVVPSGATSGPISVVTPGGTAVSAEPFTVVPPPTLTGFTPATGPVGTGVTLNGTHFLGATDVRFNGVRAVEFEVVSGTSIEAVVPSGATSGPISVVTPGGMAVSAEPFTVVPPPTLTGFTPTTGPAGTRVTLTGTHFLGATDVRFNGVGAVEFEVVSGRSIEAVVPSGATSGPISVVTPGGMAVSAEPFTVTTGIGSRLFVPVVLRSQGRTPGSFFTSEMTLTNRGSTTGEIHYTYRASFGVGSGTAVDSLGPGRQRIVPDAIAYLASLGVPIGEGAAGGTLVVDFSNLSSESDAAVTVRTSTPVEDGVGQAGLAYLGVTPEDLLTGTSVIAGLRQNRMDRSNLAVQNAGDPGAGEITLKVTVYSGDPAAPGSLVLQDLTLPPGGFHQYNGILTEAGFENGYVKVERVSGTAAYYAYGVINDNFNSDGSFVFPVNQSSLVGKTGQTLPVIVETRDFTSELTVTNFSDRARTLDLRFVADAIDTDGAATFSLTLQAGEQSILPNLVDHLRGQEVTGIGPAGRAFAGALFARVSEGDMSGIVIGARTSSPDGSGGQYGVFYNAVPDGSASTGSAWIYGLQQNATNRSNLALVNTGEVDDGDSLFSLDIYDGETGRLVKTITSKAIPARGWHQINGILGAYAPGTTQGYVQVRKQSGSNPFLAYGVVNDGGAPGERSGDGAFLPSQ